MDVQSSRRTRLFWFFARSAAAVRLAAACQLAEVGTAALGGDGAALAPQDRSGGQLGLGEKIIGEG